MVEEKLEIRRCDLQVVGFLHEQSVMGTGSSIYSFVKTIMVPKLRK